MKNILAIDVSGIYWANWHVTKNDSVSEAFERTVSRIASIRSDHDYVVVCCDSPPYWRKELLPAYKAQREAAPPEAIEQFRKVKERLAADGLLLWSAKGFEADDVIAFVCERAQQDGHKVTIASSDKDLTQLVNDNVSMHSPSGVTYTPEQVRNKFGVGPRLMREFLALCGDSSDNVPGVPGVGPKTAAALLTEFGSLEAVLAEAAKEPAQSDADEDGSRITKPKLKASLVEHANAARLAYELVGLRTDVPLEWSEIYEEREAKPLKETDMENLDDEPEEVIPEPGPATPVQEKPAPKPRNVALATRAPDEWSLALEPRSAKGAWEVAGALLNSRLYTSFGSQEAVYAVLLRGRALGLDATTALSAFHNIKGKLSMHADLIEALVLRSGLAEYFDLVESSSMVATYATKRFGSKREVVMSFSVEDAWRAGLVEKHPDGQDGYRGISESGKPSSYDKYRATMLRARAKTQLARAVFADVVMGIYEPGELTDGTMIDAEGETA